MILQISIDNPAVVAAAVTSAFDAKKAELVASYVAAGTDPAVADADAESALAKLRTIAEYIFYSNTKITLELNSTDSSVSVIGDNTLSDNVAVG